MSLCSLTNPILARCDSLRDPAIWPVPGGYYIYYTRHSNYRTWWADENWAIARVFTPDFKIFTGDTDLFAKGHASPGDIVQWRGRYLLPFQSYPTQPSRLCVSESVDALNWSAPRFILPEANTLAWNIRQRAIDPTFVVAGDTLHCYFVGSCWTEGETDHQEGHANLLGHAWTHDPQLENWTMVSVDAPLFGRSDIAPDGVENVLVFRPADQWLMIYSEGLRNQHLALAESDDLFTWTRRGVLDIAPQAWMAHRYGAPSVWREGDTWQMLLMGEDTEKRGSIGLLTSADGLTWNPLPESDSSSSRAPSGLL